MSATVDQAKLREQNRIMLYKLLLIIPVMLLFCALLVPLYRQICQVLGITASRTVTQNTQVDSSRLVNVEFVSHINRNFAWKFEPVEKKVAIHPGSLTTVRYRVTNTLSHAVTGQAVPSFSPLEAGIHFNKLECFCFTNQTLQAGETREMPVTFYVSPDMPREIENIAVSYTFFNIGVEGKKS